MTHSVGRKLLERIEQLRLWMANMDHRRPLVDELRSHSRAEATRWSGRKSWLCLAPLTPSGQHHMLYWESQTCSLWGAVGTFPFLQSILSQVFDAGSAAGSPAC